MYNIFNNCIHWEITGSYIVSHCEESVTPKPLESLKINKYPFSFIVLYITGLDIVLPALSLAVHCLI